MAKVDNPGEELNPEAIEERVRSWVDPIKIPEDIDIEQACAEIPAEIYPYIAVSRKVGAGASKIIEHVAKNLELEVLDKEILDYLAEHYKLPRDMLEILDEKVSNWLSEVFGIWLGRRMVSQSDYLMLLGRFVLMAAHNASVIFTGRGVQLILPREKGLAVRIVAPLEQRIQCVMERQRLNRSEAERYVVKRDAGRRDFVRRHFHQDVENALLYDLVINTENCNSEDAAVMIVDRWVKKFDSQLSKTCDN